jgi:CBS domain-containing protein
LLRSFSAISKPEKPSVGVVLLQPIPLNVGTWIADVGVEDTKMSKFAPIGFNLDYQVHCCNPEQTVADAAHAMWKFACRWLPVVTRDKVVVGVITDTDIRIALLEHGARLEERLFNIMTRFVVPVRVGQVMTDVEKLLQWSPLRRFPLVDESGQLRGVVSFTDFEPVEMVVAHRARMVSGIAPTIRSVLAEASDGPLAA